MSLRYKLTDRYLRFCVETRAAADPLLAARFEGWKQVWEKCTKLETSDLSGIGICESV